MLHFEHFLVNLLPIYFPRVVWYITTSLPSSHTKSFRAQLRHDVRLLMRTALKPQPLFRQKASKDLKESRPANASEYK